MPDIAIWPNCDHKCMMCSNESDYKFTTADYTLEKIKEKLDKFITWDDKQFYRFSDLTEDWTITGWEPTLNPHYFEILSYIREKFPNSRIVQLTHGDNFSDNEFVKKISTIPNYRIVFPLHWYNKKTHEAIVGVSGSWEKLIKWIYNVLKYKRYNNQTLELRFVIQGQNYKYLNKMYELVYKHFSAIDSMVTIMMEYEWKAIDNIHLTKINYTDVMDINERVFLEYAENFWTQKFKLYHFPLCTIKNIKLWKYMWRTLPPDEIEFLKKCESCEMKKYCMWIHENYCKYVWESEIIPFTIKDKKNIHILENKDNFRFQPILEVSSDFCSKKTVIFTWYTCNNLCRFCIDLNKRHIDRDTKEILRDILIAKKDGTQILEIIWWEVTIRKDFFIIMSFIKWLNFKHVYLVTNGNKLADYDFAKKFYDMYVIDSIVFSIHWPSKEIHDVLTQTPGSFERLIKWIETWKKLWFDMQKIWTNTAIEKWNYKDLLNIWKYIKRLWCYGSSEFIFADPNQGWVNNNFDDLMPKISDSAPYIRELLDWWNKNNMLYRVRYVPLCYFEEYIESNISEIKEIEIYSNITHRAPDFYNSDVVEWRKNTWRIKPKKCIWCKLYNKCEWIWKNYYDKLWDEELKII